MLLLVSRHENAKATRTTDIDKQWMEGLGRVQKPMVSCEWFSASSIDLLMQTVNHDICCSSGLPQLSVMPSLIPGDWQFLPFFFNLLPLQCVGFWGPSLLHLLTSSHSLFFFFFWKISSVKEVPCHRLGMYVLTAWPQRSLMFVQGWILTRFPGLGVFPQHTGACL